MLVLFETAAGYAIFKLLKERKLLKSSNLYKDFETPEKANQIVKLQFFQKFVDTAEALEATAAIVKGKISTCLEKTLNELVNVEVQETLLVADEKLGSAIKERFNLQILSNSSVQELMRCIRSQLNSLLVTLTEKEMTDITLDLALSHSCDKVKFSPEKIGFCIIKAISILDESNKYLDKISTSCRQKYDWHFPELGKIVTDNITFAKTVKLIGKRKNAPTTDLSDILPEDIEAKVKEAATVSSGIEISQRDIQNICQLCDQVIEISRSTSQIYNYLQARMMTLAPNVTVLVGELIGARLISHAGSLINLAHLPASTIQNLGAKGALKTRKITQKYGLIYHTQLVDQATIRNKGKISRSLAAKVALAIRVDAFGEDVTFTLGAEHKAKLESRLKTLEENNRRRKAKALLKIYHRNLNKYIRQAMK